jgi:hypothetical protein
MYSILVTLALCLAASARPALKNRQFLGHSIAGVAYETKIGRGVGLTTVTVDHGIRHHNTVTVLCPWGPPARHGHDTGVSRVDRVDGAVPAVDTALWLR